MDVSIISSNLISILAVEVNVAKFLRGNNVILLITSKAGPFFIFFCHNSMFLRGHASGSGEVNWVKLV